MEIQKFGSCSPFAQMISDKLQDKFLFDNLSPTKKEISKIKEILQKFLNTGKLKIENLSENVKDSLNELYEFRQIDLCLSRGVTKDEFPNFCSLIDECVSHKIEELNNKNPSKRKANSLEGKRREKAWFKNDQKQVTLGS